MGNLVTHDSQPRRTRQLRARVEFTMRFATLQSTLRLSAQCTSVRRRQGLPPRRKAGSGRSACRRPDWAGLVEHSQNETRKMESRFRFGTQARECFEYVILFTRVVSGGASDADSSGSADEIVAEVEPSVVDLLQFSESFR